MGASGQAGATGQGGDYQPAPPLVSACEPGKPCEAECVVNATCDDNAQCVGDPAPDGTRCATPPSGCTSGGACQGGLCACGSGGGQLDLGTHGGGADGGTGKPGDGGCDMSGAGGPIGLGVLLAGVLAALFVRRRRA